jgi:predicted phage terminase large subunit-like protein
MSLPLLVRLFFNAMDGLTREQTERYINALLLKDLDTDELQKAMYTVLLYSKDYIESNKDFYYDASLYLKRQIIQYTKNSDLYWDVLKFEAVYWFDSYLIYLEKNRDPKDKFYIPKRKQLMRLGLIQLLQDLEDDKLDIASISMPPSTQKTTLEKFFLTWVMGRHPDKYNLFYSHSADITRIFYDGTMDITVTNTEEYTYREIFPHMKLKSTNAKDQRINFCKYKPYENLQCTSVGAKNAGRVRCNGYLLCDDLIGGIEEALSGPRLDKIWNYYSVDARQRKMDGCKELHVCTRWSVRDVVGRLKNIYGDSKRVRFIAVPDIDPETGKSNFDYDYNGFTVEFYNDVAKTMDAVSYKALYKNEPIEREGLLYHDEDLKRYLNLPVDKPDAIISIADTKNKGTDFFSQPVLYVYGEDYYMVDCICDDNPDYGIQYEHSTNIIKQNGVIECKFESNNGGDRVGYEVDTRLKAAGHYCNITCETTSSNKETKIYVYAPWVKQHVYFKDKSMYDSNSDYGRFIDMLLSYSVVGKNEHDDPPDVMAMLAEWQTGGEIKPTKIINSPI